MSRRRRALVFLFLALAAAAGAAAMADGYGSTVARRYGPLRPVVVVSAKLPGGERIDPADAATGLSVRRVPARFVPSGALASPAEALGLVPDASLPAGSYLLAAQLHLPRRRSRASRGLSGDRRPVEISVSGAEALLSAGPVAAGARVDVVVTGEPGPLGRGRTYVAAAGVPLLALRQGVEGTGEGGIAAATLGLTREQALRLINADSFARKVTLLPGR
jgi:Flp pilus assembly protein CpaB